MRLIILLSVVAAAVFANARPITQDEAAAIALDFFNSENISSPISGSSLRRVMPKSDNHGGAQPYYIFNNTDSEGFVIVSGDNSQQSILGYSHSARFNSDNVPPQLDWMLDLYAEEIKTDTSIMKKSGSRNDYSPIEPLISSKWGQGAPFNDLCPVWEDSHYSAGCVTIAIAQILNFHNWPSTGEGSFSYKWQDNTFSIDYGNTTFNWNNILDGYNANSPQESKQEVSKLIRACTIGLECGYEPLGTGSNIAMAKRMIVENLKYSNEAKIVSANSLIPDDWNKLMYDELKSNRPIYLQGGDHAFVCDGYGGDNHFHFNWGWEGNMDGYFLFPKLKPSDEHETFSDNLLAMINIKKRDGEKKPLTYDLICTGEFLYEFSEIYNSGIFTMKNVQNYSRFTPQGSVGVEIVDTKNDNSTFIPEFEANIEGVQPTDGAGVISTGSEITFFANLNGCEAGSYEIYPVFMNDSECYRIPCIAGGQDHINLTVSENDEYHYSNPGRDISLDVEISEIALWSYDGSDKPMAYAVADDAYLSFKYQISNKSKLAPVSNIQYVVYNNLGNEIAKGLSTICIQPDTSLFINNGIHFIYLQEGSHMLRFFDEAGNELTKEPFYFEVKGTTNEIKATGVRYERKQNDSKIQTYFFEIDIEANLEKARSVPLKIVVSQGKEMIHSEIVNLDNHIIANDKFKFSLRAQNRSDWFGDYQMDVYDLYDNKLNNDQLAFPIYPPDFSIELEASAVSIDVNQSIRLYPLIICDDYYSPSLEWESSNNAVATVNDGLVTGISTGSAIITIRALDGSEKCASCEVTVEEKTSIDSIEWLQKPDSEAYYTPSGIRADKDNLSHGVYILLKNNKAYKIIKK